MQTVSLPADTNQALGIARYAIDFMSDDPPSAVSRMPRC